MICTHSFPPSQSTYKAHSSSHLELVDGSDHVDSVVHDVGDGGVHLAVERHQPQRGQLQVTRSLEGEGEQSDTSLRHCQ